MFGCSTTCRCETIGRCQTRSVSGAKQKVGDFHVNFLCYPQQALLSTHCHRTSVISIPLLISATNYNIGRQTANLGQTFSLLVFAVSLWFYWLNARALLSLKQQTFWEAIEHRRALITCLVVPHFTMIIGFWALIVLITQVLFPQLFPPLFIANWLEPY